MQDRYFDETNKKSGSYCKKFISYIVSKKISPIFQKMELSSPKIKKSVIFSQKKLSLYFAKKAFLTFQEISSTKF